MKNLNRSDEIINNGILMAEKSAIGDRDFFEYVLWTIYDANEYFVLDNIEREYLEKI